MTAIIKLDKPVWQIQIPENATAWIIKMFSFHPGQQSPEILLHCDKLGYVLSAMTTVLKGTTIPCDLQYAVPPDCHVLKFEVRNLDGKKVEAKDGTLVLHYEWDAESIVQEDDEDYFKVDEKKSSPVDIRKNGGGKKAK
jgi:hypothetical protein